MRKICTNGILVIILINIILIILEINNIIICTISVLICFLLSCYKDLLYIQACRDKSKKININNINEVILITPFSSAKVKNAFTMYNSIVIEENFYNDFSNEEICAIVYHEIYHLKHHHHICKLIISSIILWLGLYIMIKPDFLRVFILLILLVTINIIFLSYSEFNADKYVISKQGESKYIISVLKKLERNNNSNKSYFYSLLTNNIPTISARIKKLCKTKSKR